LDGVQEAQSHIFKKASMSITTFFKAAYPLISAEVLLSLELSELQAYISLSLRIIPFLNYSTLPALHHSITATKSSVLV
jgi:hypothetical protein